MHARTRLFISEQRKKYASRKREGGPAETPPGGSPLWAEQREPSGRSWRERGLGTKVSVPTQQRAGEPALLCNPPAHRTNPRHQAEFRPNTTQKGGKWRRRRRRKKNTTSSFYHSIPHQLDHLPPLTTTDLRVSLSRWECAVRRFPRNTPCTRPERLGGGGLLSNTIG